MACRTDKGRSTVARTRTGGGAAARGTRRSTAAAMQLDQLSVEPQPPAEAEAQAEAQAQAQQPSSFEAARRAKEVPLHFEAVEIRGQPPPRPSVLRDAAGHRHPHRAVL
eukprot:11929-Prymnesium_polylepis.1